MGLSRKLRYEIKPTKDFLKYKNYIPGEARKTEAKLCKAYLSVIFSLPIFDLVRYKPSANPRPSLTSLLIFM